jgi:hypothetical protein
VGPKVSDIDQRNHSTRGPEVAHIWAPFTRTKPGTCAHSIRPREVTFAAQDINSSDPRENRTAGRADTVGVGRVFAHGRALATAACSEGVAPTRRELQQMSCDWARQLAGWPLVVLGGRVSWGTVVGRFGHGGWPLGTPGQGCWPVRGAYDTPLGLGPRVATRLVFEEPVLMTVAVTLPGDWWVPMSSVHGQKGDRCIRSVGGIQWETVDGDKEVARRVINFWKTAGSCLKTEAWKTNSIVSSPPFKYEQCSFRRSTPQRPVGHSNLV